tara:strand:- start:1139 stop:1894 length:756 start_codon:yes stop_codon:yes gene_type:complete
MLLNEIQEITASFDPISLSEMDAVGLMKRMDTKFVLSEHQFSSVFESLKDEYSILEINQLKYSEYESLYFDHENMAFYRDHHRGKANRMKIRIRKYKSNGMSFLEVKKKEKGQTVKSRIMSKSWSNHFTGQEKDFLSKLYPNHSHLIPSLENSFVRITLVHKTQIERLTFDLNLSYLKENKKVTMNNLVICELKQERVNRMGSFYSKMKNKLIRPLKVSKYCLGVMELNSKENIKSNRFKKKILKLNKILC